MSVKTGDEFALYVRDSGTHESPHWLFVPCRTVKRTTFERKLIDTTQRSETLTDLMVKTQKPSKFVDLGYEVEKLYEPGDDAYDLFYAAFLANAILEFLDLDATDTTTGIGLNFPAYISGMPMDEPMEEGTVCTIKLAVANDTWVPQLWPVGS